MGKVVEWSIRDESIHVEGIAKLFRQYCLEYPRIVGDKFISDIYKMSTLSVELEDKFVDLAYALGDIEGLPADDVKSILDILLIEDYYS